jgi:hypothetical protein
MNTAVEEDKLVKITLHQLEPQPKAATDKRHSKLVSRDVTCLADQWKNISLVGIGGTSLWLWLQSVLSYKSNFHQASHIRS